MLRIFKTELPDVLGHQLAVFKRLEPFGYAPEILKVEDHGYWYTYVEGHPPCTFAEVCAVHRAAEHIWGSGSGVVPAIGDFLTYLERKVPDARKVWIDRLIAHRNKLRPAEQVQGDMTLENIVIRPNGQPVFIDPSPPRGLVARQVDEAKMLQSLLTEWEWHKREWKLFSTSVWRAPFPVSPLHIVLLALHWIRLLRHLEKHPNRVFRAAPLVFDFLEAQYQVLVEKGAE